MKLSIHHGLSQYDLYGCRYDGQAAYLSVSYGGRTQAEFKTLIVYANDSHRTEYGHPKRNGITKANGWSINPEMLHGDW